MIDVLEFLIVGLIIVNIFRIILIRIDYKEKQKKHEEAFLKCMQVQYNISDDKINQIKKDNKNFKPVVKK